MSGEHHIELFDVVPIFFAAIRAFDVGGAKFVWRDFFGNVGDFIGAETLMTFFTFDEWVRESGGVARSNPSARVHNNSSVDAINIVAIFDEIVPPGLFDFSFKGYAERAIVPSASHATIDIATWKNKATAFA